MNELRVLSTMGLAGVLRAFGPEWEGEHGTKLDAEFMPTVRLLERIRDGERGDVAILTDDGLDALIGEGVVEGRVDLARSYVGVAVRAGAPHPDISTRQAFIDALLGARSVVMSKAGASGIFMAGLLERLGIADAVRPKATILASGFTAELAASGEAELAIQQVSELQVVPGVEIVGRIPAELGGVSLFAAGLFRGAPQREAGQALLDALADPARAELYRGCGLEPVGTAAPIQA